MCFLWLLHPRSLPSALLSPFIRLSSANLCNPRFRQVTHALCHTLALYLRTGTGACPYDCVCCLPSPVSPSFSAIRPLCLMYFLWLPHPRSLPSALLSPFIRLSSANLCNPRFRQVTHALCPTLALYLRTGTGACPYDCDCFCCLPSPHLSSAIRLLCLMCFLWLLHPRSLPSALLSPLIRL